MSKQVYSANYGAVQRSLGMAQVMMWVPANNVPLFLASAEAARIEELEKALQADDDFRIKIMAARNKKAPPPSIAFDQFFHHQSYFMKGGKGHKQAMEVYAAYVAAVQNYTMLLSEANVAQSTRSLTMDRKAAEVYVAGLKLTVAERKGEELAAMAKQFT